MKRLIFVLLVLPIMLSQACLDEPECITESSNLVKIYFYKYPGEVYDSLLVRNIILDGSDSLFYKTKKRFNVELPLNHSQESLPVIVSRRQGGDTISFTINYEVVPKVISEECGVEIGFVLTGISDALNVDSVAIVNYTVGEEIKKNIEIYRKDCSTSENNEVEISFYKYPGDRYDSLRVQNIILDGSDSLFYNFQKRFNVKIPLKWNKANLPVIINQRNGGEQLSFNIDYEINQYLVADWCEEIPSYTLTNITNLINIDSVALVNTNVRDNINPNLELYFKDCSTDKTNDVIITIYDLETLELYPVLIRNVIMSTDDSLYYKFSKKSKIVLPFKPDETKTSIVLSQREGGDSLFFTLNYDVNPFLISDWCGESSAYTLSTITDLQNIDSVAIIHPNLSTSFAENIQIYLKN